MDAPRDSADDPRTLFRCLGFGFVHRFLWTLLAATAATLLLGGALSWWLEGDVTVRAEGRVHPVERQVVKSRLDGRVQELRVRAGDRVDADDVLVVLSPREIRAQLAQVEGELALSDLRRARLASQIEHDGRVLAARLEARAHAVERARLTLEQVRQEQSLYSRSPRPGWRRRALDELLPVRLATLALATARADREVARRQLQATGARQEELALEEQTWRRLEIQRRLLWARLEATVVRAPAAGVILTEDLPLRVGDQLRVGDPLLEIASGEGWRVRVHVSETDRPKMRVDQPARVFLSAYPHLEYGDLPGRVEHVGEQATPAGYPVDVRLDSAGLVRGDEPDGSDGLALADGMAAEVRVTVASGRLLLLAWRRFLREAGRAPAPGWRMAPG